MAKYFDYFPIIPYDIAGKDVTNYQAVRDIFFRLRVIRSVLNNISAYYEYMIKEGDTPEILAEKVYRDPEAHWIILMANDIVDAAYDWPLTYDQFNKYIKEKYGSIEYAQTHYHHYEKVIQRTESLSGLMTETRFIINEEPYSNTVYYANNTTEVRVLIPDANGSFYVGVSANSIGNTFYGVVTSYESTNGYISFSNTSGSFTKNTRLQQTTSSTNVGNISLVISPEGSLLQDKSIPYYTYDDLAETQYVETFNIGYATKNSTNTLVNAGRTVYQVSFRDKISYYDYENELNERKRVIKIIKPEYYSQIVSEFYELTGFSTAPYLRKLIV